MELLHQLFQPGFDGVEPELITGLVRVEVVGHQIRPDVPLGIHIQGADVHEEYHFVVGDLGEQLVGRHRELTDTLPAICLMIVLA